jgi:hypothetical protein
MRVSDGCLSFINSKEFKIQGEDRSNMTLRNADILPHHKMCHNPDHDMNLRRRGNLKSHSTEFNSDISKLLTSLSEHVTVIRHTLNEFHI